MSKRKRQIVESEVMDWAEEHPLVKNWLAKIQIPEKRGYFFAMFCNWTKLSPEELYALKDDPKSREVEYLLDNLVADKEAPFTKSVKWQLVQAVKSFFSHNYRDLAKKAGKIHVPKVKPTRKPMEEELRQLWKSCFNHRDRALVLFVNSTAVAKGTLAQLTWSDFEDGWEEQENPALVIASTKLKGSGVGKWEGVKQITFLTPEAKDALIEYKKWIENKVGRELTGNDHVWLNNRAPYEPLSYSGLGMLVWRLAKEAGVKFSWHDARRYVETALEETKINPNWARKIRGRKVRGEEAPYSQPAIEQLRAAYREAVPKLQFLSAPPAISEDNLRIKTALDQLRMSGHFPEEQLRQWQNEWLGKDPRTAIRSISLEAEAIQRIADREGLSIEDLIGRRRDGVEIPIKKILTPNEINETVEKIKRERRRKQTNKGNCANGHNCQRIVGEEELPALLAKGWHVAAVLPSRRIVICNEG